MNRPVFVLAWDRTQGLLSRSFVFGAALRGLRPGLDEFLPVRSWDEFRDRLLEIRQRVGPIARIEWWGHGASGHISCAGERLVSTRVAAAATDGVRSVAEVFGPLRPVFGRPGRLWLRTCSTFWGAAGREFGRDLAGAVEVPVTGHRYDVHAWQSGLEVAEPGVEPSWGDAGGGWSLPWYPGTVFCLSAGPWED